MKRILKRLLKKDKTEEGQAFAEYMVLFPGAIMIVIAMGYSLGVEMKYRYCEVVGMFSQGLCEIEPYQEPDGSTFCHCEAGEGEGALGRKNCHIAKYNPAHADHYWDYYAADGDCAGWHDLGLPGTPTPTFVPGEPTPTTVPTLVPTAVPEGCTILELTGDCSQCDNDADCVCLPGVNAGIYEQPGVESLVIYAGKEYHLFYSGFTDDGCYYVTIDPDWVTWEKYFHGKDCKKIDHLQAWQVVLCPGPDEGDD